MNKLLLIILCFVSFNTFAQLECEMFDKKKNKSQKIRGHIDWSQVEATFKSWNRGFKDLFDGPEGCEEDDIKRIIKTSQNLSTNFNIKDLSAFLGKLSTYRKVVKTKKSCKETIEVNAECGWLESNLKKILKTDTLNILFTNGNVAAYNATQTLKSVLKKMNSPEIGCNVKIGCEDFFSELVQKGNIDAYTLKLLKRDAFARWGINDGPACNLPEEEEVVTTTPPSTTTTNQDPSLQYFKIPSLDYNSGLSRAQQSTNIIKCDDLLSGVDKFINDKLPAADRTKAINRVKGDVARLKQKYNDLQNCKYDEFTGAVVSAGASDINSDFKSSSQASSWANSSSSEKYYIIGSDGQVRETTKSEIESKPGIKEITDTKKIEAYLK